MATWNDGATTQDTKPNKQTYSERMQVPADIINLISSEDEAQPVQKRPRTSARHVFANMNIDYGNSDVDVNNGTDNEKNKDTANDGDDNGDDDDELEVVSCVRARPNKSTQVREESWVGSTTTRESYPHRQRTGSDEPANATQNNEKDDANAVANGEQVEVVQSRRGVQALVDYAHFRFQCATKAFKRQRIQRKQLFCQKCFCYVCDIPADKCAQWKDHCKATDTVSHWRNLRKTRLDDRRKLAVDPRKRGTHFARCTTPIVVSILSSDDESDDDDHANNDDPMNTDNSDRPSWYPEVDRSAIEAAGSGLESILIDASCFTMGDLGKVLDAPQERMLNCRRKIPFDWNTTSMF